MVYASQQNRPDAFGVVDRGNGWYTPVVALDELPSQILIRGLPRSLKYDQIHRYQVIGKQQHRGLFMEVQRDGQSSRNSYAGPQSSSITSQPALQPSPFRRYRLDASLLSQSSAATAARPSIMPAANAHPPWASTSYGFSHLNETSEETQATLQAIRGSSDSPYNSGTIPPPSGIQPDPSKKTHCTYWLQHGTCAYVQQGCLYKHEIPATKREWEALGFRSIPQWIQEKNAVKLKRSIDSEGAPKKNRFSDLFAKLKASRPGEEEETSVVADVAAPETRRTTLNVPNPLGLNPPTPRYPRINEKFNSSEDSPTTSSTARHSGSSSSENGSLIDLAKPMSSRSSSPTTIIASRPTQVAVNKTEPVKTRPRTGIYVPSDADATTSHVEQRFKVADRPPTPGLPVSVDSEEAKSGHTRYIHYFPRQSSTDSVLQSQPTYGTHPHLPEAHRPQSSKIQNQLSNAYDTAQRPRSTRPPRQVRFNSDQHQLRTHSVDRYAVSADKGQSVPNAPLARAVRVGKVAPTPGNSPVGSVVGLATSKHAHSSSGHLALSTTGSDQVIGVVGDKTSATAVRKPRPVSESHLRGPRIPDPKGAKAELERLKSENRELKAFAVADKVAMVLKKDDSQVKDKMIETMTEMMGDLLV